MRNALYVFVDGMSESVAENSSLAQARTPTMDWVAQVGAAGFYHPGIGPHHTEPKTDVVIPAFFGLAPAVNPGRAALEWCDRGASICPGEWYCSLKLAQPSEHTSADWRTATVLGEGARAAVVDRVTSIGLRHHARVCPSEATQYGERLLLGADSKAAGDASIGEISEAVRAYGLAVSVQDYQEVPANLVLAYASQPRLLFLGWAKGSLRGAFRYLGARCNPFTRAASRLYDWETYEEDFERWCRPRLERYRNRYETMVLYTKQAAFASRRGERQRKIEVIGWMDRMMSRVLAYLDRGTVVVALADHSADLEGYTNPPVNTPFALARWEPWDGRNPASSFPHFCEATIQARRAPVLSQEDLMRSIEMIRA